MLTRFILLAALAAEPTPLEKAQAACPEDPKACEEVTRIRAANDAQLSKTYEETVAAQDAAEKSKAEALQKKCGKNYRRLKVGMAWSVVKECTGFDWSVKAQDQRGTVYEAQGGYVRVEAGKVVKWIAP